MHSRTGKRGREAEGGESESDRPFVQYEQVSGNGWMGSEVQIMTRSTRHAHYHLLLALDASEICTPNSEIVSEVCRIDDPQLFLSRLERVRLLNIISPTCPAIGADVMIRILACCKSSHLSVTFVKEEGRLRQWRKRPVVAERSARVRVTQCFDEAYTEVPSHLDKVR